MLPVRDDVPAAHSMDSEWWAVDAAGEVAVFVTGEDGSLPIETGVKGGNAEGPETEKFYKALKLEPDYEGDTESPFGNAITCYANTDYGEAGKYERKVRPAQPLRIESLPEDARKLVSKLTLPVTFAEAEVLQLADLGDLGEIAVWSDPGVIRHGDANYEAALRGVPEDESSLPAGAPGPATAPVASGARPGAPSLRLLLFVAMALVLVILYWMRAR